MSDALIGFGDLFAASPSIPASAAGARRLPTVAVLTAAATPQPAAAGVALALAAACGTSTALVACVAAPPPSGLLHLPASYTAAARLRREGQPARPCGRLVWLAAAEAALPEPPASEPLASEPASAMSAASADPSAKPSVAAASSALHAVLARAAGRCGLPAVLGIGGARSDALDRLLLRHDGIVVVLPAAEPALVAATLASLASLGPPAAAMPVPRQLDAATARAGLRAPRAAVEAVAALGVGEGRR